MVALGGILLRMILLVGAVAALPEDFSSAQSKFKVSQDPSGGNGQVPGLCRRWGQQSTFARKSRKLYMYGGKQAVRRGDTVVNETNMELLMLDLDTAFQLKKGGVPWKKITPRGSIKPPAVRMGGLYSNAAADKLILFEGQAPKTEPEKSASMWQFNLNTGAWAPTDTWRWMVSPNRDIPFRRSRGAVVDIPGRDEGYYLGGLNAYENGTFKGWQYHEVEQFVRLDLAEGRKMNPSGFLPMKQKRIGPEAVYIEGVGDKGIIVLLGGTEEHNVRFSAPPMPSRDGGMSGIDPDDVRINPMSQMDTVWIYDIARSSWHFQTTQGDDESRPFARKNFCMGTKSSPDNTQHYIYIFGGGTDYWTPMLGMNDTAYNDMFILTLPAFRWQRVTLTNPPAVRQAMTCHVVDNTLLILGGTVYNSSAPAEKTCEQEEMLIFDMSLLQFIDSYTPALPKSVFQVPTEILDNIGRNATPQTWDDRSLQQLFMKEDAALPSPFDGDKLRRQFRYAMIAAGVLAAVAIGFATSTFVCIQRRKHEIREMNVKTDQLKYLFGYQEPTGALDRGSLYYTENSRPMNFIEKVKFKLGIQSDKTEVIGGFYNVKQSDRPEPLEIP